MALWSITWRTTVEADDIVEAFVVAEKWFASGPSTTKPMFAEEIRDCVQCDEEFTGEPVRDSEQVTWMRDNALVFCSAQCLETYAERRELQS